MSDAPHALSTVAGDTAAPVARHAAQTEKQLLRNFKNVMYPLSTRASVLRAQKITPKKGRGAHMYKRSKVLFQPKKEVRAGKKVLVCRAATPVVGQHGY